MHPAEPNEVRNASHGAVVIHDLAYHPGRIQTCETGEIDCCLSLTSTLQHAASASAKRENVSRPREVFRTTVCVDCGLDSLRAIVSRDARCHAGRLRINRNRKRGTA